jgi:hypothetical protein
VRDEKPSATAWRVALARAAHQIFDTPIVFDDPLALRIVGAYAHGTSPEHFFHDRYKLTRRARFVRALLVIRSRVAEEELVAASSEAFDNMYCSARGSIRSPIAILMWASVSLKSIILRPRRGSAQFSAAPVSPNPIH